MTSPSMCSLATKRKGGRGPDWFIPNMSFAMSQNLRLSNQLLKPIERGFKSFHTFFLRATGDATVIDEG
jgi:hypothetical protein